MSPMRHRSQLDRDDSGGPPPRYVAAVGGQICCATPRRPEMTPSDLRAVASRNASRGLMLCTSQTCCPKLSRMSPSSRHSQKQARPSETLDAARIEAALMKVAALVAEDPAFAPIFERLEAELTAYVQDEMRLNEAQRRARALLAQKAMRATSSATCSSDAPLPYRSRSNR
ncbi:hypothetical protein Jann_3522 [Jannaschia sp. CCS1]|nr:hypothetical protein Jann_3522 [Jannaschia sp. CCS1]